MANIGETNSGSGICVQVSARLVVAKLCAACHFDPNSTKEPSSREGLTSKSRCAADFVDKTDN